MRSSCDKCGSPECCDSDDSLSERIANLESLNAALDIKYNSAVQSLYQMELAVATIRGHAERMATHIESKERDLRRRQDPWTYELMRRYKDLQKSLVGFNQPPNLLYMITALVKIAPTPAAVYHIVKSVDYWWGAYPEGTEDQWPALTKAINKRKEELDHGLREMQKDTPAE